MTSFNSNYNQTSPASYGQASPSYPSPCGSRHTPQGSPAPPAAARLPLPPPTDSVAGPAARIQRLHSGTTSQPTPAPVIAPLPVPASVPVPAPAPAPVPLSVPVHTDTTVVHRVSVITEQSKVVNVTTDSVQSHNGGEVSAFFNSRQQSVTNQVGTVSANSECVSSRTSNDCVMKEENNVDYNVNSSLGAGLPEELPRPISESASVSSIPRTHTPHMAGECIHLHYSEGSTKEIAIFIFILAFYLA